MSPYLSSLPVFWYTMLSYLSSLPVFWYTMSSYLSSLPVSTNSLSCRPTLVHCQLVRTVYHVVLPEFTACFLVYHVVLPEFTACFLVYHVVLPEFTACFLFDLLLLFCFLSNDSSTIFFIFVLFCHVIICPSSSRGF